MRIASKLQENWPHLALAAGAAAILPVAAGACVIFPPECAMDNGVHVQLVDYRGDGVVVMERDADRVRVVLVHCPTRQAVMTSRVDIGDSEGINRQNDAMDRMLELLRDDAPQTLREVQDAIKAQGVAARRATMPRGYCACDLRHEPYSECPPMEGDG